MQDDWRSAPEVQEKRAAVRRAVAQILSDQAKQGLTQAAVAQKVGIDGGTVSRWASGKQLPGTATAAAVDRTFPGYNLQDLVTAAATSEVEAGAGETRRRALRHGVPTPPAQLLFSQRDLYESATQALTAAASEARPRLWIAALHGHGGKRSAESANTRYVNTFDARTKACLEDPGWQCRRIVSVTSVDRLEQVEQEVREDRGGCVEIRAYADQTTLAMLSPLIVGSSTAFLATQDALGYRVDSGIRFDGAEATDWVASYFLELWDGAPFKLRTPTEVNEQALAQLRSRVIAHTQPKTT